MSKLVKWVIINKKTGNVAYTRESGYHKKAVFTSRQEARNALREGRVLANTKQGMVRRFDAAFAAYDAAKAAPYPGGRFFGCE